jgi:hypothetical protein
MVKVLRVENDEQKGMYSVYPKPDCIYSMQSASNHPTPEEDAALRDNWYKISRANTHREWYFGFSDLKQLRNWIYRTEWRDELTARGLKISVYEVTHYHIGDTQSIFRWEDAKLIERFGFDEVYTKEI